MSCQSVLARILALAPCYRCVSRVCMRPVCVRGSCVYVCRTRHRTGSCQCMMESYDRRFIVNCFFRQIRDNSVYYFNDKFVYLFRLVQKLVTYHGNRSIPETTVFQHSYCVVDNLRNVILQEDMFYFFWKWIKGQCTTRYKKYVLQFSLYSHFMLAVFKLPYCSCTFKPS